MTNDFFSFETVTDNDAKIYGAAPGTIKITDIEASDDGVVSIPETVDGLPVTLCDCYFGGSVRKLIIPRTLVAFSSMANLPDVADELIVDKDNPEFSTDGVSLLSKDGKKLFRMCQRNRVSYSIPDGVTEICSSAFESNRNSEISIPDSVTTVGYDVFHGCSYHDGIQKIYGGKNIVNVESNSFSGSKWYSNTPVIILGKTLIRYDLPEERVIVPEGIAIIGPKAFDSDASNNGILEAVTLPSTLKEIGEYAFFRKKNLREINFPSGLMKIKENAFRNCESLHELVLPDSIVEIGEDAFHGCSSITKATIPHAVSGKRTTYIEAKIEEGVISTGAFSDCGSLESFEVPEGMVAIGDSAFNGCASLKNIDIPETVQSIGKEAFANCFELEEIFIPAGCEELGENALPHSTTGCGSQSAKLSRIDVEPQNRKYGSVNGILCSENREKIIFCPSRYDAVDYYIPEGIKEILPGAFQGCEKIKKVIFSHPVEKIGANAFASMSALEEIVLPHDCPSLGDGLFMECRNLKSVTWPDNLREIGESCFARTGIESLTIPETVESIGKYAFSFIKARKVTLPKTVKNISLSIFAGIPEIEVYDSIDSDAKPASECVDSVNGSFNGKVGGIGVHQRQGYIYAACNSDWYEHAITVRSAEDGSVKYKVRMPNWQKRKAYCTYASSWGKNAEFNFNAIDEIFKDLTADAKLDYVFDRLHCQTGITEEMLSVIGKYVSRNAKAIAERIFQTDDVDDLAMFEPFGIVKKNTVDERIADALKANASKCKTWLLNWQKTKQ